MSLVEKMNAEGFGVTSEKGPAYWKHVFKLWGEVVFTASLTYTTTYYYVKLFHDARVDRRGLKRLYLNFLKFKKTGDY